MKQTKKTRSKSVKKNTKSRSNSRSKSGILNKVRSFRFNKKRLALLFVLLFAGIGAYLVVFSSAASVAVANIEGEAMQLPTGAIKRDISGASQSQVAKFTTSGTAVGTITNKTPASSLTVTAFSNICKQSAEMVITIDDTQVLKQAVLASKLTTYSADLPTDLAPGQHVITIAYTNDVTTGCNQDLYVDKVDIFGFIDTDKPSAPKLTITAGDKLASLSWTASKDDVGVVKYQVWKNDAYLTNLSPQTLTYDATGLTNGTNYSFRIVASDAAGNYINSNTMSVAPKAAVAPPPTSPSGQNMPKGDVVSGGHTWRQIVAEDFTKDAPLGSWDDNGTISQCGFPQQPVVYTGATGVQWKSYPKCYKDTYNKRPYRSDKVLSVKNGVLDFWLHNVDGQPAGANPGPVLPGGSQYQTYGRYEARFRVTKPDLSEYYTAWLLWPTNDSHYKCAESDFPEGPLSATYVKAFHHYGSFTNNTCTPSPKIQDAYTANVNKMEWHTYTQEWMPGRRNYYVDGKLIGSSTNAVWDKPQRWQLQTETKGDGTHDGHLEIDWVTVYAY